MNHSITVEMKRDRIIVEPVTTALVPQWLMLAREMEPIFQGSMVSNEDFHNFIRSKIEKKEAYAAFNETASQDVMGIIAFSRSKNSISWLAVSEEYRQQGVGSELLKSAMAEMNRRKEITVITFRAGSSYAAASQALYTKFGFRVRDNNACHHGQPRCVMCTDPM